MPEAKEFLDRVGKLLVGGFVLAALFIIGATTVWSAMSDYLQVIRAGRAGLDDLLLLFIYLEIGTMVGIYFRTDRLPVLFLLYVAITALTRFLVVDIKELAVGNILFVTGSIVLLTVAVLVLQIAASKFTSVQPDALGADREGGSDAESRLRRARCVEALW